MNPKVDSYLDTVKSWKAELQELRRIVLDCMLTEELKWKVPCYTYNGGNVVMIHAFKNYCALLFHKGSLLHDPNNILIQQTENVQFGRQIRFTSLREIIDQEAVLKSYIFEAIQIEKDGLKVPVKKTEDYNVPEELMVKFNTDSELKNAFEALTPGRQRGYLLHFSQPKQSETRVSRIENNRKRIMMGKGLTDCICGLSKRMPACDGSHKQLKN